jgi:hypothetical protein
MNNAMRDDALRSALSAAEKEQDELAKEFVKVYAKLQEEDAAAENAGGEYYKALSDYWEALNQLAVAHMKWDFLQRKWRKATMPKLPGHEEFPKPRLVSSIIIGGNN